MADLIFTQSQTDGDGELRFGDAPAQIERAAGDLVFTRHHADIANAGNLVFGRRDDAQEPTQAAAVTLDVSLPALAVDLRFAQTCSVALAVSLPVLSSGLQIAAAAPVQAAVSLPVLQCSMALRWNSNTYRPDVAKCEAHLQQGIGMTATRVMRWQPAQRYIRTTTGRQQQARKMASNTAMRWQAAATLARAVIARHQIGAKLAIAQGFAWQSAHKVNAASASRVQHGCKRDRVAKWAWQSGVLTVASHTSHIQHGVSLAMYVRSSLQGGVPVQIVGNARWQQAMWPMAGIWRIVPAAPRDVCYIPPAGDAVHLLFAEERQEGGNLLFKCTRWIKQTRPLLVVPRLDIYMHLHDLRATLFPSGEPIAVYEATISTDDGGYAWQLNANGGIWLMEQLAPVNGQPCKVRIEIDGVAWIFAVGSRSRNRQWPTHSVSFTGSSTTSLLDTPHLPIGTFSNTQARMAQQLVAEALEHTGTALDWQIPDWEIPAGVFTHQGSPLSAALKVADSVGAIVQSDKTGQILRYLSRYPSLPWEWSNTAPRASLPANYVVTDALQEQFQPAYNAIYTAGTTAGFVRKTNRAGTAGDVQAQIVVDALLTSTEAHTERARAVLGAAGHKANITLTLPVNTAAGYAGVLDVNDLVEIADTDATWRGLVRSVSLTAGGNSPVVNQTVRVERQLA